MLRINQIALNPKCDSFDNLKKAVLKKTALSACDIKEIKILKRSIDARKNVKVSYSVLLEVDEKLQRKILKRNDADIAEYEPKVYILNKCENTERKVVVCGFGPCGMFCALTLAQCGIKPIVLERGSAVEKRSRETEQFFNGGKFNANTNVQFGEGGAGTFSDGKLNTGINDPRLFHILKTFVENGAPEEILYAAKPHVGTDILKNVVRGIREQIISLGGKIYFDTQLCNIDIKDETVRAVTAVNTQTGKKIEIACDDLVCAIGHSARDTFELFKEKNILISQKPFAIGVRAEHPQSFINKAQYKGYYDCESLGAADYKLWTHLKNGRGVYSFCMCPGGVVVSAASEEGGVVTNGMSYNAREGKNANAAILCDVRPEDFDSQDVLAGVYFQRKWEQAAYNVGGKNFCAPISLMGDFLEKKVSKSLGSVNPTYLPSTAFADLDECLPQVVCESIRQAIYEFDKKIKGYNMHDAVLTGVETRSSSPVRILRNEKFESVSLKGFYPAGEGAGYAGGIMSAAADGIKIAEAVLKK